MTTTTSAGMQPGSAAGARIAALAGALQAIMDFYLANPGVPEPTSIMITHDGLRSRADLDALAGDFDQPPPPAADAYIGAQFDVQLEATPIRVQTIFSYYGDGR